MSAVLSQAESKFFESRGQDVDASLGTPTPAEPPETPPEPAAATPAPAEPPKAAEAPKAPETPPEQPKNDRHVPLEALHDERRKRMQAEAERQQLFQQFQEMQRQLQQLQQPREQAPDPEADPMGYLAFQNRQMAQQLEQVAQWRQQQEQTQNQQRAMQQFQQRVSASEVAYRQAHPDYDSAAQFALQQYDKLLSVSFPDPAQRQQQIQFMAANELARVVNQGGDPADFVYNFAKSMGYTGAAPAAASPTPSTPVPSQPAAAAVPDAVKTIQKGLKQQANLGSGGSTPPSEMTPEMLLGMDGEDFQAGWKKAFGKR